MSNFLMRFTPLFLLMVNICILLMVDLFAGLNQGIATSNCNTVVIKGYINPPANEIIENYIISLLSVAHLIGSVIGSFSCSILLDKLGPKNLSMISGLTAAIFHAISIPRVHWGYLFAMRLLMGIPSAIISTVVPSWIS